MQFDLTPEEVAATVDRPSVSDLDCAFQTILRNRVNRGGILAHGAGRIKRGELGKGLASRWYPQTLKQRILDIVRVRERLHFVEGDGLAALAQYTECADCVFFIDPPYTAGGKRAGSRLYNHSVIDHEELFRIASMLRGDFLMTYDDTAEIHALAKRYHFSTAPIAMKNTHHAAMTELLVGRDLAWYRSFEA